MSADYAGACTAIKDKFAAAWTSIPAANTGYANEADPKMTDSSGLPASWARFEIVHAGSRKIGAGTPGASVIVYDGLIKVHIFTPNGSGDDQGRAYALAAGEIFRNQVFFDGVTPGCFVRSGYDLNGQPRIDEGGLQSEDGLWFATTATIPFEYWHRG